MSEKTPAKVARFAELPFTPRFEYGEMAQVTEVTSHTMGTRLGSGFGRFTNAEIPWTVQYDEVLLVLEGSLTVRTQTGNLTAGPKDSIWLPTGTELTYVAESALVFYAIEPSNWAEES
ncbi:MAG: ethanolamine utilization protein EutQ [Pseudomonadota bacterium]